jgi:hypothetical protein
MWSVFPNGNKQLVSVGTFKWLSTLWPEPKKEGVDFMESAHKSRFWYGEKYEPLYPDHDFSKYHPAFCWTDNFDKMVAYYDTCPVEYLIEECNEAFYVDDVLAMLHSLHKRQPEKAIELAKAIIDLDKAAEYLLGGVKILQEEAKTFLEEKAAMVN